MRIYPAIDIKDGKCVRLMQGKFDTVTVFDENPADVAAKWQGLGAEYIHLVDLDGAKNGSGYNGEVIRRITERVTIPVQVGGGIRTIKDIEDKLNMGVARVIIGTSAVRDRAFVEKAVARYGNRIAVGIDAKNGMVALSGWEELSEVTAVNLCIDMKSIGVETIIFTDISRDGMMSGPNFESTKKLIDISGVNIIASGGVSSYDELLRLKELGVEGAIVGKALYLKNIELDKAIELCGSDVDFSYLNFNETGLITAVTQDYLSKEVLMVAYMNRESLARTIETGMVHYYSRSRKKLWLKGETSGHFQHVKHIKYDCDADALLVIAEQSGAACHTGEKTCFFREIPKKDYTEN